MSGAAVASEDWLAALREALGGGARMAPPVAPSSPDPFAALLLAVGGLLGRETSIEHLLDRLVDHIVREMGADRGTLYLVDRAHGALVSKAAHLPELREIRLRLGQGIAGWVAQTGEVVNVPSTTGDDRFFAGVDEQTGYRTDSCLAVPMRDRAGAILGVVQLLNKRGGPFAPEDETALAELARHAAVILESTTLYAALADERRRAEAAVGVLDRFQGIVGESEPLRAACRLTSRAAATQATVLIRGESGTGKELFARAVWANSPRRDAPFVKVDCAALPATLIDNELFGHEKGAFTGADARTSGKIDAAQGGTLFLDELGELPLAVQGKLLRLLQDREFQRVGGVAAVRADVRVVAATNRDLRAMVEEGSFRADLYYRIKVVEITLPPLRERGAADLLRLARHFAASAARRNGRPLPRLSEATERRLLDYRWPGNAREMENCLESAIIVMDGDVLLPEHLPLPNEPGRGPAPVDGGSRPDADLELTLEEVERRHVLRVLEATDGHRAEAARRLGIGRNTLSRKLARWGL